MRASSQNDFGMLNAFSPESNASFGVRIARSANPFMALEFVTGVAIVVP